MDYTKNNRFTNWVKECITDTGFAQLNKVDQYPGGEITDVQRAYILAET